MNHSQRDCEQGAKRSVTHHGYYLNCLVGNNSITVSRYKLPVPDGAVDMVIIERAGATPWRKLFQDLRATREIELMARYPAKDVSSWLGNSTPVAMKYQAMEESFQSAADPKG